MIKNLVFKGGGILGIAYAGAIHELELMGKLKAVERVAGTSAGSIVACLVALKYSSAEIADIVNATDFKSFEDDERPFRTLTKYGVYSGDAFLSWMESQITKKGLPAEASFSEFVASGFLDLTVFATDLNTKSLKKFCVQDTPNVCVAEAIRASMSIPLFFCAHKFKNNNPDDHIYVDGGCIYNYPITTFDEGDDNPETLGLFLTNLGDNNEDTGLEFNQLRKYIGSLAEVILSSQTVDLLNDDADLKRTILINSHRVSATNFGITNSAKNMLYESGRLAALTYFTRKPID